jgi:hypothetical protein
MNLHHTNLLAEHPICCLCGQKAIRIVKGHREHHPACKVHFKKLMETKRKRKLP